MSASNPKDMDINTIKALNMNIQNLHTKIYKKRHSSFHLLTNCELPRNKSLRSPKNKL